MAFRFIAIQQLVGKRIFKRLIASQSSRINPRAFLHGACFEVPELRSCQPGAIVAGRQLRMRAARVQGESHPQLDVARVLAGGGGCARPRWCDGCRWCEGQGSGRRAGRTDVLQDLAAVTFERLKLTYMHLKLSRRGMA